MDTITDREALDLRGKTITTFIAHEAAKALQQVGDGGVVELLTDDAAPVLADLQAWAHACGHVLLAAEQAPGHRRVVIQKGPPRPVSRKLAMVISNPGLEELLSPLGFALAAALEGIQVHLYFQGPAVRVLERGFTPRLRGWARPFSRFARQGLARTGHIGPQDKLAQLRELGARIYLCGPSMEHFRVRKEALIFTDLPIVEYLTFAEVMAASDIHLFVQ
jgi:predicted peroxiredoxin/TusA-related sulfurtransferase